MKIAVKRLKDSTKLWAVMLVIAISSFLCPVYLRGLKPLTIFIALLSIIIFLRLMKVIKKDIFRYINGPWRFCKGRGIEIGSGSRPMVKGSLTVDLVTTFSTTNPYKVDYVADAHDLPMIHASSMDYVCASNVLEHLTNPIKAIIEWLRILKPGGILWLKIPDKRKTFDRKRERTRLGHLIQDFRNNVPVDDCNHIDNHNKNSDPLRKETHPYVHNHVWIPDDIVELIEYVSSNHIPARVIKINDNTCKNAQDFWIVVQKG